MMQYLSYFKIKFITGLQYRLAALAGLLTQIFFGLVFIMVYLAFYQSDSETSLMPIEKLITYIWLGQAFYSLTFVYHIEKDITTMIKNGDIAYELCKPGNLYLKWYFKIYGSKLSNVTLRFFPVILITIFFPKPYNLCMPPNIYSFIGFIITLFIGSFLITAFVTLLHVLMFYTIDAEGVLNCFRVIAELFAGMIVPIPLLPGFLRKISSFLPFQYISDIPYRIYVGLISFDKILFVIIIQIFWLVLVFILGLILTKRLLKKVVVQGG